MQIAQAHSIDAPLIAAILLEAAEWLAADGRPLWLPEYISLDQVAPDVAQGLYFVARNQSINNEIAGVMKFELEDPVFWPELPVGSSAFVHKLAIRRASAKQGVSTALLRFAQLRAAELGRPMLRLDCVADRAGLRQLYEQFGFSLHSTVQKGAQRFARYELLTASLQERPATGLL